MENEGKTAKFSVGDKVKIVNYGHLIWVNKGLFESEKSTMPIYKYEGKMLWIDLRSDWVGKETIVTEITTTQGILKYGTKLFSWANEGQLEKI